MNSILKQYEERRAYPRVELGKNAIINLDSGEKVSVLVHDISTDGMQLRCDRLTAAKLHPSGKLLSEDNAPELNIMLALPCDEENHQHVFNAMGKLKYLVRLESDIFAIGIYFSDLNTTSKNAMEEFIAYSMCPEE